MGGGGVVWWSRRPLGEAQLPNRTRPQCFQFLQLWSTLSSTWSLKIMKIIITVAVASQLEDFSKPFHFFSHCQAHFFLQQYSSWTAKWTPYSWSPWALIWSPILSVCSRNEYHNHHFDGSTVSTVLSINLWCQKNSVFSGMILKKISPLHFGVWEMRKSSLMWPWSVKMVNKWRHTGWSWLC